MKDRTPLPKRTTLKNRKASVRRFIALLCRVSLRCQTTIAFEKSIQSSHIVSAMPKRSTQRQQDKEVVSNHRVPRNHQESIELSSGGQVPVESLSSFPSHRETKYKSLEAEEKQLVEARILDLRSPATRQPDRRWRQFPKADGIEERAVQTAICLIFGFRQQTRFQGIVSRACRLDIGRGVQVGPIEARYRRKTRICL